MASVSFTSWISLQFKELVLIFRGQCRRIMDTKDKLFFSAMAKVIYSARKDKKMTQSELAVSSGLDRTYISDIERGKRNPTISVLLRLAEALGVSVSVLILRTEYIVKEGKLL